VSTWQDSPGHDWIMVGDLSVYKCMCWEISMMTLARFWNIKAT